MHKWYYVAMRRSIFILFSAVGIACSDSGNPAQPDDPNGIRIPPPPAPLVIGEAYTLIAFDAATNVDESLDPTLGWTSSNEAVATVAAGLVTAKAEGSADIIARIGGKTGKVTITVTDFVRTTTPDVFAGGVLGFSSSRNGGELDLYLVGPGGVQRITTSPDHEQFDGWSPDASRVAVLRFPENTPSFSSHTIAVDGTNDVLVSQGVINWAPDWKHHGTVVQGQIRVSNADGSDTHTVGPVGYFVQGPWWSRDGQRVAFAYSPSATTPADIYVANADGSGVLDVTNTTGISEDFADWSPDGLTLAVTGANSLVGTGSGVYTVSVSGTGLRQLTHETYPIGDYEPQWSPDGKRIMYTTYFGSTYGIYIIDPAGGNPQRFSPPGLFSGFGRWSPDGKQVAFTGYNDRQTRYQDVFVMTADRKSLIRITRDQADNLGPFWKPN
jgi:Tol biopolymer transport system component